MKDIDDKTPPDLAALGLRDVTDQERHGTGIISGTHDANGNRRAVSAAPAEPEFDPSVLKIGQRWRAPDGEYIALKDGWSIFEARIVDIEENASGRPLVHCEVVDASGTVAASEDPPSSITIAQLAFARLRLCPPSFRTARDAATKTDALADAGLALATNDVARNALATTVLALSQGDNVRVGQGLATAQNALMTGLRLIEKVKAANTEIGLAGLNDDQRIVLATLRDLQAERDAGGGANGLMGVNANLVLTTVGKMLGGENGHPSLVQQHLSTLVALGAIDAFEEPAPGDDDAPYRLVLSQVASQFFARLAH